MGLDNGIEVRRRDGKKIEEDGERKEIIYLRKFWFVRDDIVGWLNEVYGTDGDTYNWELDDADLIKIEGILREWIGRVKNGEEASTIWEREEEIEALKRESRKIWEFREWLRGKNREDYIVEFYDSY